MQVLKRSHPNSLVLLVLVSGGGSVSLGLRLLQLSQHLFIGLCF
jgi:hypothetical protein